MQRAALSVLLALALVFAGCSGAQQPGSTATERRATSAQPTTTQPSTTSTATAAPTRTTAERLAPGVTRAGVVNASALVDAHVSSLDTSGYEHRMQVATETRISEGNETVTSNLTRRVRATPGLSAFHLRSVHVESDGNASQRTVRDDWSNGTVRLLRAETGNRTAYERLDPAGPGGSAEREVRLTGRLVLSDVLRRGDFRVETDSTRNGATRITLVADSAPNATEFSATAVVDGDSRIRRLNATMTLRTAGSRQTRTVEYRLVEVGVEQVERPAWMDEALGNESG